MIRINLLRREQKKSDKASKPKVEVSPNQMTQQLAFVAIFVATIALAAYFWFDIQGRKQTLDEQVAAATTRRDGLLKVKERVDELNKQKDRMQNRLLALDELQQNMRSPKNPLFVIFSIASSDEHANITIKEVNEESGKPDQFVVIGEANKDDLNNYSDALGSNQFVEYVEPISQSPVSFRIRIHFRTFVFPEDEAAEKGEDNTAAEPANAGGSR